ncbi:hypothetical protein AB833_02525 [Chromatiales bacterium (ex Bugula neritina AB1)]|nr:hypothetical protein AB833_02525 [Chromatiales bacterium (ex Bugula neritina AB1)]
MVFGLFDKQPVIDPSSSEWIFDAYGWALQNFDADLFYSNTVLVRPTNEYFPGTVNSVHGMAEIIFDRVKVYAGISHWPTLVKDPSECQFIESQQIQIQGALRGPEGIADESVEDSQRLVIPYNPQQINNPEGMIATYAHILSHHMGQMAKAPPPGGIDYWPQATELLAIFLGFGLMFANSAYNFRGGCGSCYNPYAQRDAYLSEAEATYALGLFCLLKGIPDTEVTPHLKRHLRGIYRKSSREIANKVQGVDHLKRIQGP